eukprot:TRINITY_DN2371_c0_g1_i1.p1 TRINITY_DN2371_c0_g1~~TRINITY_DN2371_c0_g1_i1.p1  ORF type:complete len:135 (-),score=14.59 TRINITY_DN2371_c0_g1_i1:155-559(-)
MFTGQADGPLMCHIVCPRPLSYTIMAQHIRRFGYADEMELLPYDQWRLRLLMHVATGRDGDHPLGPVVPCFPSQHSIATGRFLCVNTLTLLRNMVADMKTCPPAGEKLVRTYLTFLVDQKLIRLPKGIEEPRVV